MDLANAPDHVNTAVDGSNAMYKRHLKEQMELIGKWENNSTSNIGMLPSASKYVSIKISDKFINIINNKGRLNGLKCGTKMQKK